MADIEFEDNSIEVKTALEQAAMDWLYEAAGELQSRTQRNTSVGKVSGGGTKGAWKYKVDESAQKAVVGNPEQTAIWLEFGTGEYALKGDGRKGGWYIPIGNGSGEISPEVVEAYHFKVVYGKNNKKFAYTTGIHPQRPLHSAFTSLETKLKKALENKLKGVT